MKRPTLKDIAKVLGVNTSTISRGLNDHQDISAELKAKIKSTAELFGYIPNLSAVNLKAQSTKTIALILPKVSKFFVPSVIEGVTQVLQEAGYKLVILCSNDNPEIEKEHIVYCCKNLVDGILLSLATDTQNLDHLDVATKYEIPVILFDNTIKNKQYQSITIDDAANAKNCMAYLESKDATEILCVMGHASLNITRLRKSGVDQFTAENPKVKAHFIFAENIEDALDKTNDFLDSKKPHGVFCMSDEVLVGATKALYQQDSLFNIPIVAFSDGTLGKFHVAQLAYIDHSGFMMGSFAAQKILGKIANEDKSKESDIELAVSLIK